MNNNVKAHAAALRRLSERANNSVKAVYSAGPLHSGLESFSAFAKNIIERLRKKAVSIDKGLTEQEFLRIEAACGFTFPPDLRAVLEAGLPVGAGFPDWRSGGLQHLRMRIGLPAAGLTYEAARGSFWCKSWGNRPDSPEEAVSVARAAINKAPVLVPLFSHCYIPANPNRAGNPIFFVYRRDIFCCASDLEEFFDLEVFSNGVEDHISASVFRNFSANIFHRRRATQTSEELGKSLADWPRRSVSVSNKSLTLSSNLKHNLPRWIEFWSDLAERNPNLTSYSSRIGSPPNLQRNGSKKEEDQEKEEQIRFSVLPRWLDDYLDDLTGVLRRGGWKEQDITEMLELQISPAKDDGIFLEGQTVVEGLLLKADLISSTLRRSGWTSRDISDIFEFEVPLVTKQRPILKVSATVAQRIGKLAESLSTA